MSKDIVLIWIGFDIIKSFQYISILEEAENQIKIINNICGLKQGGKVIILYNGMWSIEPEPLTRNFLSISYSVRETSKRNS